MSFDMWLHELVNLGVPVSTGTALDRQIHKALQSARIESTDHCAERSSLRAFGALHQLDGDPDDGLMYPSDKGSACLSRGVGLSDPKMETDLGDTGAQQHHFVRHGSQLRREESLAVFVRNHAGPDRNS